MGAVYTVCCGLDVHAYQIEACLRTVGEDGHARYERRPFEAHQQALFELADWLSSSQCQAAAMESTGVYWKSVYALLNGVLPRVVVAHAGKVKRRGPKTDKKDARWLSNLLAQDEVPPSFVPPADIQSIRELMRARYSMLKSRTQLKNRVHKLLHVGHIKLSGAVSDIFVGSGRAMLDALVGGERDVEVLLSKARKAMQKRKGEELKKALKGELTADLRWLIGSLLEQLDVITRQLRELEQRLDALISDEIRSAREQLKTLPGVDAIAALQIISEVGLDMQQFGSASRLASWSAMCPGTHQSAGKSRKGQRQKGNKYLRAILAECAWSTRKTDTFLGRKFRQLEARIGGAKAAVAIGHKLLRLVYFLLSDGTLYDDSHYDSLKDRDQARELRRIVKHMRKMGWQVETRDDGVEVRILPIETTLGASSLASTPPSS